MNKLITNPLTLVRNHQVKIYLDTKFGYNQAAAQELFNSVINDCNFVLKKNTNRRFLPPQVFVVDDTKATDGQGIKYPSGEFDYYIEIACIPAGAVGYGSYHSDGSAVAKLSYEKNYFPDNNPQWVYTLVHEFLHTFSLGIGELYKINIIEDISACPIKQNIYSLEFDIDEYWSMRPDWKFDPMRVNSPIDTMKISDYNAFIANGDFRRNVMWPDKWPTCQIKLKNILHKDSREQLVFEGKLKTYFNFKLPPVTETEYKINGNTIDINFPVDWTSIGSNSTILKIYIDVDGFFPHVLWLSYWDFLEETTTGRIYNEVELLPKPGAFISGPKAQLLYNTAQKSLNHPNYIEVKSVSSLPYHILEVNEVDCIKDSPHWKVYTVFRNPGVGKILYPIQNDKIAFFRSRVLKDIDLDEEDDLPPLPNVDVVFDKEFNCKHSNE